MDILDNLTNSRPLSSLQRPDLIEYSSDYISKDLFVVYGVDIDTTIPALMVQLWKFSGGYDHGMYNVVVNDLAMNQTIPIQQPNIHIVSIKKILNYRNNKTDLSDKEIFIMNIKPDTLVNEKDNENQLPYECTVDLGDREITLNIPNWTPLQKLPVEKIKKGSILEIWECDHQFSIMKVRKL